MGHKDIESTAIYLHVSKKHLQAATNPLEQIPVSGTAHLKRSKRMPRLPIGSASTTCNPSLG